MDSDRPQGGAEPFQALDTGAAAVAVALDKAGRGRKRDSVDAFLEDQRTLVARQLEGFDEQQRHQRLKHFDQWLSVSLKLLTAAVGALVLGLVGLMAWNGVVRLKLFGAGWVVDRANGQGDQLRLDR